jgi:hypothetical protein
LCDIQNLIIERTRRHLSLKQVPRHRLCRYIDINHQQKPLKRHIERFSDESVFSGNAVTVVFKNGGALIFANFFQHCSAAEFVEITRTRADHLPWQLTIAAELLLDGCKIEPYTIIIMMWASY